MIGLFDLELPWRLSLSLDLLLRLLSLLSLLSLLLENTLTSLTSLRLNLSTHHSNLARSRSVHHLANRPELFQRGI